MVNFLKLREADGQRANPALAWLMEGERLIRITARVRSSNGKAIANITHVEVNGVAIPPSVLDLLVKTFITPLFPEASLEQEIELSDNVDRIDLRPGLVRVSMR
jgi:hypothetical protein